MIEFTVTVNEGDWNNRAGGWNCPALKIPESGIKKIYAGGRIIEKRFYELDQPNSMILCSLEERPQEASVSILINTDKLSTKKEVDDANDRVKRYEEEKIKLEERAWKLKILSAILTFISTILVALITVFPDILNSEPFSQSDKVDTPNTDTIPESPANEWADFPHKIEKAWFLDKEYKKIEPPIGKNEINRLVKSTINNYEKKYKIEFVFSGLEKEYYGGFQFFFNDDFYKELSIPNNGVEGWSKIENHNFVKLFSDESINTFEVKLK